MDPRTSQMGGKALYGQTGTRCQKCNGKCVIPDPADETGVKLVSCPSCGGSGSVRRIATGAILKK